MRVANLAAKRGPSAHRVIRAEIRPLAEIGLPENDCALRAQTCDERTVASSDIVFQCQSARRRRDRIEAFNIVFEQDRNAIQRPERFAGSAPRITRFSIGERVRIERQNRLQFGTAAIHSLDPRLIGCDQFDGCEVARRQRI